MATADQLGSPPARIVHRLAVLAVCLIWPLIWVGGLVSTYDAGMAVPDWPSTYGYNLFLYPYKTWLLGPFDLFIEHGHRLLGAVVGFVAIGMLAAAYLREPRRWMVWLAVGLLLGVISQGLLGGMRVVLGDRTLAMIHGCVAPVVFALFVAATVMSSRFWWREPSEADSNLPKVGKGLIGLAIGLVLVSYLQLVFGAQLRHVQPNASPGGFAMTVALHVMTAFLLWMLTVLSWSRLRRCGDLTLSRPAGSLIGLLGIQILLGVGTWAVNYGWPSFLQWVPGSVGFLLRSKGFLDSIIVTAHVATGSLILGVSTLVLVRLLRVRHRRNEHTTIESDPNQIPIH
ncbi:MAG: heme A synthase [Rubripirellula sp.]